MLLKLPEFELLRAGSVEAACALVAGQGGGTRFLAGGTDLFTRMKHRRLVPRRLVDIKRIPHLEGIRPDGQGLSIGPVTTAQALESSPVVRARFPALAEAAGLLGTLQIRNSATIGGNLANASPCAEFAPPLLTLGASLRCADASGAERWIGIEEFFVGPGRTALRADELIVEIRIPNPPPGAQGTHLKHSLRRMDVAIASAAALVCVEGDVCTDVRIALGAVAPTSFRARRAEDALRGRRIGPASADLLEEVARTAAGESVPIDDLRSDAAYRKKVVGMLVGKALERTLLGTGKGRP